MFDIPGGLPSGRFLPDGSPTMWQSDDPVADPMGLWEYCDQSATATGIWPVLSGLGLYHPIRPQRLRNPARVEDVDLERELRTRWEAMRARQAKGPSLAGYPEDLEDREEMIEAMLEAWPQQWPPYEQWPGLAPAVPDSGQRAAEVHRRVLEETLGDCNGRLRIAGLAHFGPCLALVQAEHPADIPAVMAWEAEAPNELLSAMLRSWEDRFGARVVAFEGATLHVSVARPPVTVADASLVAFEHVLLGDDNHRGGLHFADYANSLIGDRHWQFWWD
jgi:hypothetical protein